MKKKVSQIAISIFLILVLFSSQFILPTMAQADTPTISNLYKNPNQQIPNNPYKLSLKMILNSGVTTQVLGCTGLINDAAHAIGIAQHAIGAAINSLLGIADPPVETQDKDVRTVANTAAAKSDCIDGIAVQLAKTQLSAMTRDTMSWINTGFNGNPLYVQDTNSFMNSITDQILQKETDLFKNPATSTDYPYGRDYAQGAISAQQSAKNFAGSMKQDLTTYLSPGSTPQSFATDFSQGGWDGWLALTQHPQNNPLGFTMEETNHTADLQNKAVQQTQAEIDRNQGYLDQKKCVLWSVVDANNIQQYNDDGSEMTTTKGGTNDNCLRWATVTPGSTIKDKVSTYINSPERQLELVKTLNDALNALFSNLLNNFRDQGLSGLNSQVNNYTNTTSGGAGTNAVFDALGNALPTSTVDNGVGVVSSGDGFFDLTRDLGNSYNGVPSSTTINNRGVLQLQQDYIDNSKKVMAILPNVLTSVGHLDYCLPGPNPNWQSIAQTSISSYISSGATTIDPSTIDTMTTDYASQVDATYGPNSPMQDPTPGNTSYLDASLVGLNITKDLSTDADSIASAQQTYKDTIVTTTDNIATLNVIKDKVNAIIKKAQARRATERKIAGKTAMPAACTTAEKVTYVVNGQVK